MNQMRKRKKKTWKGEKGQNEEADEEEGLGLKGIVSNYETDLCESQRVNQAEIPPKLSPSSGLGKLC